MCGFGWDKVNRSHAILFYLLPRTCTFIAEGVKVNVVQNNLVLFIYLMRMVRPLLDNPALYFEKYLDTLIPSVSTCIVSRQSLDIVRLLMAQICENFNTSTNNLQTRVTRLLTSAIINEKTLLSTLYGTLAGLLKLGTEVISFYYSPVKVSIGENRAAFARYNDEQYGQNCCWTYLNHH